MNQTYAAYSPAYAQTTPSSLGRASRPPSSAVPSSSSIPLPNLRGFGEDPTITQRNEPPLSMGGMEPALPTADSDSALGADSNTSEDTIFHRASTDRHEAAKETYKKGREVIAHIKKKTDYAEDAMQIIQRLQMAADRRIKRTYVSGQPTRDYYENAPTIKVGIVFLPGVDRPTVTQLEQDMLMADYKADQMNAEWRVNTAGQLLLDFEVTKDLRVIASDSTPTVLENSRRRRDSLLPSFIPGQKREAVVIAGKDRHPTVNIDSEQVTLVPDLRYYAGQFDLESTLIEVDETSIVNLLVNFQIIIERKNAAQDLDETRNLLEAMMEDVRRLCNRSAILFRMSTRMKIITGKDIRYGVSNGRKFTTLTTSKGIRNIISKSSAYYTALDPADKVQQLLKPRFLQMLVLLLSFLNDDDLRNIQVFLERTFHFKADRKNIELLFLKVIPFYSINSHVFLTSMVPAFEGWQPMKPDPKDQEHYWETFLSRIANMGYILPGTVENLCRAQKSWIVQWPAQGFKNSLVFRDLQYCTSDHMRTFNEIPPIEKDYDRHNDDSMLTAVLTNSAHFQIRVADYEAILCLTKGVYNMQEADANGRRFDLLIEEGSLNQPAYHAVDSLNDVIKLVNSWLTGFKGQVVRRSHSFIKGMRVPGVRRPNIEMMEEVHVTGKLSRYRALLGNTMLAIAYKLDGRKITLDDALATLSRDNQTVQSVVDYYQERLQYYASTIAPDILRRITNTLNNVATELSLTDGVRQSISADPSISDEPIVTLIETAAGSPYLSSVWNNYNISLTAGNMLTVDAKKSYVTGVHWGPEIIITLHNDPNQYIVAPLEYVEEKDQADQVQQGDVALLVGKYMILAEPVEEEGTDALIMSNYLKIVREEQGMAISKRQQRRMPQVAMSRSTFV